MQPYEGLGVFYFLCINYMQQLLQALIIPCKKASSALSSDQTEELQHSLMLSCLNVLNYFLKQFFHSDCQQERLRNHKRKHIFPVFKKKITSLVIA